MLAGEQAEEGGLGRDVRSIGQSMRICRVSKGLSVEALAERSGVSRGTIYHSERDESYPGVLVLTALADALDVGLDEYIGRRRPGRKQ